MRTSGADLLASAPRQAWLAAQLGGCPARYAHIGLVANRDGVRLAKRDGAVSLADLKAQGWDTAQVLAELTASLGLGRHDTAVGALTHLTEPLPASFHAPATWTGRGLVTAPPL